VVRGNERERIRVDLHECFPGVDGVLYISMRFDDEGEDKG